MLIEHLIFLLFFLLFQSKTPQKICLIDFQIARFASPVLDLLYFLFTSTVKSIRDQYFKDILNIYYSTLSTTIRKLGSDPDQLFPFDVLERQLKKFGKYGVLIAPTLLQVITADPTDIPDMDQLSEDIENNKGNKDSDHPKSFISSKTQELYNTRVRDVVRDAEAYGYLNF